MLQLRLDPQEVQFVIAAIQNVQIYGRDAHMVSGVLKKFEDKLDTLKEVK